MVINKKHAFFWGAVLFFSQLLLWVIDLTAESTSFMNHRLIGEQWPWYARVLVLMPGLCLMAYSQYPRSWFGKVGLWVYRLILWLIKTKRSQKR